MRLAQAPASTEDQKIKSLGAVVLLSGGLDSTTCLFLAAKKYGYPKKKNLPLVALSFDYNQKHKIELKKSKKIANLLHIPHYIQKLDPGFFKGSSLTEKSIPVPKSQEWLQNKSRSLSISKQIPNTYVPARNTLFLSFALALAEGLGYGEIYIGVNVLDYSGYPDCRPEFIRSFQSMADLATKVGVSTTSKIKIQTPLIDLNKKDIVLLGKSLGVPFGLTHSCYDPIRGKPCRKCESCLLRKKGFLEADVLDE